MPPKLDPLSELTSANTRALDLDSLITKHSQRTGLDPELVRRLVKQESGGRRGAISPKGASGLMQLMPDTARSLRVRNPFDPDENIRGGTDYLKQQLDKFGDVNLALAAYNAGPGAVEKHGNRIPPYRETQNYVKTIGGGYEGTGYAQDPLSELTRTDTQDIDPLTEITSRPVLTRARTPKVTSTITPLDEIPVPETPIKPAEFKKGAQPISLNPVENLYEATSGGRVLPKGVAGLQARRYEFTPSQELSAPVTLPLPKDRIPNEDDVVNAYLSTLGNDYVELGKRYKAETGHNILTLGGGALKLDDKGNYYVRPTKGAMDFINAYAKGNDEALNEAHRQADEFIAAQNKAYEAAKPDVAEAKAAMQTGKESPLLRGMIGGTASAAQAFGSVIPGSLGNELERQAAVERAASEQLNKELPLATTGERIKAGIGGLIPTAAMLIATHKLGPAQLAALGVLEGTTPEERLRGGLQGATAQAVLGGAPAVFTEAGLPTTGKAVTSGAMVGQPAVEAWQRGESPTQAIVENLPFAALPFLKRRQRPSEAKVERQPEASLVDRGAAEPISPAQAVEPAQVETPRHVDLQPRRKRGIEAGQFKKETRAERETRRATVEQPITPEPEPTAIPEVQTSATVAPPAPLIPEAAQPVKETTASEPWQMTRREWIQDKAGGQSRWNRDYPSGRNDRGQTFDEWTDANWRDTTSNLSMDIFTSERHKRQVQEAIREGKPVPPEVLADYPDLAAQAARTTPSTETVGKPVAASPESVAPQEGAREGKPATADLVSHAQSPSGLDTHPTVRRFLTSEYKDKILKAIGADAEPLNPTELGGIKASSVSFRKPDGSIVTVADKAFTETKAGDASYGDKRDGFVISRTEVPPSLRAELKSPAPPIEEAKPAAERMLARRGEAGGIDVDLLTLGVRPFAKDVAERGREIAAGTQDISNGIKSLLAPPSRSEQAQQTSRIVRANASEMARAHDIADKSLEGARKYFSKQQLQANYDFIDKMERGQAQDDSKTQKFADTFRKMLDDRRDQIRALGTGKLENFIEDYFPHIWKDPAKAKDAFASAASKRPFEGSKSFLKQRTLPLTSDGLALGLEPVSNNPVDLAVLKLREMDKYLMAHQVMNEMKDQGNLKFFKVSERLPDGWAQIDDRVATVFSRGEKGELILRGRYAAPESAAKIVNNYLSPGLDATAFRVPFRAWRATSNLLNQFQLGFSAFHAGFTTVDAMVSRTAVGLEDIIGGRGLRRLRGLGTVASTPISPLTNLIQGSRMLKEWYQPGTEGAEIGQLVKAMQEGGGRARMDQFYTNNTAQRFVDTLRQGNILGAAIRTPGAVVELLSKPVMEQLVPRQKMGIFADLAKRELERLAPGATEAQRRHVMAKAWDSVDNRMGQLVYDNLFWNKTLKDLSMASVRSVGWNIGTIREIGGGLYDTANLLNKGMGRLAGKRGDPLFTHRMAYTAALPLVVGTMGAITQYLLTGKGPDELKDYFFPKTGAQDENGNPERISFPSYMKDVFHAKEEPGKVVTNKLHPLAGLISEMLRNEDYYGTKIRNEDDPIIQQLKDVALHAGQSALPFSVRGYQKETERGGSVLKRVAPFVGITPAPAYINKSEAEKLISRKTEETLPRGARTREEADRSQLRHQLQTKARNGQDISSEVSVAIKQGKLRPDDAHDILRDAKQTPLQLRYKHLTLKDALEVWDVMTSDERNEVKDILAEKATSVDDLPETEQDAVKKKMESIGLRMGIVPRKPREPRQPRKPRKPLGMGYVFQ